MVERTGLKGGFVGDPGPGFVELCSVEPTCSLVLSLLGKHLATSQYLCPQVLPILSASSKFPLDLFFILAELTVPHSSENQLRELRPGRGKLRGGIG